MYVTADSAMIVVKPASKPLGVEEGIGITCKAVCPQCFSDFRLTSKLYDAKHLLAALRSAKSDLRAPRTCEVCGLRSVMTEVGLRQLVSEVEDYSIAFSSLPASGKGQGALHGTALLKQIGVRKTDLRYILLKQSLPTLSFRFSDSVSGNALVVRVERAIVCGVCDLRSSRASESTFMPRSDLAGVTAQLVAQFAAVRPCEYCGSLLEMEQSAREGFAQWISIQLTPSRIASKLARLRSARSEDLNEQRVRLHALAAPDCKRHVNSCGRSSHGPQLELQLTMLEHWHS